jgi:hypothetical protein
VKRSTYRRRVSAPCAGLLALPLFLSACATTASEESTAPSTISSTKSSAEQSAALEDSVVSREEYDEGFRRYQSCLSTAGYELVDVKEEYQVITFGIPASAVDSGVDADCYDKEFAQVDSTWQLSVEDQGKYATIFGQCLADAGLDSGGTKVEKEQRLESAGITIDDCLKSRG